MFRINSLLLPALLMLTITPQSQAAGQTAFKEYFQALPLFWDRIYPKGGKTLYCSKKFGSRHGRSINIEHVYPMAWVKKEEGCRSRKLCRQSSPRFNRIEADMHNLYPAQREINKARGSAPFGLIEGERRDFGRCDFEFDNRRRLVEPRPASRGNIARAMLYMHDSYGLPIYKRQGKMLKQWNRQDPPDAEERRRNDRIARLQGTRNRFIDNPRSADNIRF